LPLTTLGAHDRAAMSEDPDNESVVHHEAVFGAALTAAREARLAAASVMPTL